MEKEVINKLSNSLNEIRNDKNISIFVIVKREDDSLWDIVIGGPNLDTEENLISVADIVRKKLTPNELRDISRIVLLDSKDNFVNNLRSAFSVEYGSMELQNAKINNIFIKHAYLLYSK